MPHRHALDASSVGAGLPDFLPDWAYTAGEQAARPAAPPVAPPPAASAVPPRRRSASRGTSSTQSTPKPIEGAQEGAPDEDLKRAKQVALRYLGPKQRTRAEIRGTLERRGFAPEVQRHVEEWLDQHALLDDIEYARAWVRARSVRKGMAPRALAQELQRKGLARGDIDAAMEEYDAEGSEQAAENHVLRALASWDGVDLQHLERVKRRMFAALQRRGHGMGSAQRLVLRAIERHRSEHCG